MFVNFSESQYLKLLQHKKGKPEYICFRAKMFVFLNLIWFKLAPLLNSLSCY